MRSRALQRLDRTGTVGRHRLDRAVPRGIGLRCSTEALHGGTHDAGPDLAAAAASKPRVQDRRDAGLRDLQRVDRGRRPPVPEVGNLVVGILAHRDVVHGEVHLDHGLGRAALVILQREGRRLGKAAETDRLVDQALAADPLDILDGVSLEQPGRHLGERPVEPLVAQPADPDRDAAAGDAHGGDHAAGLDIAGGIGRGLPARHGQPEEEVVARGQVRQRLQHLLAVPRPGVEQVREELPAEEQGRGGVAAVQLVPHVHRAAHDRLQRDAAGPLHGRADGGGDDVLDVAELVAHLVVIGPVVQPLVRLALVEVAEARRATRVIAHHEDGHGCGEHPRDRADAAVVMAAADDDVAVRHPPLGVGLILGQPLVQRGVDQRGALPAGISLERHRRPGREDGPVGHAGNHVPGRGNRDQDRLAAAHPLQRRLVGPLALRRRYHAAVPPSTGITAPVMKDDRGDSRNSTTSATSSVRPSRPSGIWAVSAASPPDMRSQAGAIGTSMKPGATVFTRMPRPASSQAPTLVRPSIAAFDAEYIAVPANRPTAPAMLPMCTTALPWARCAAAALVIRALPSTFTAHMAAAAASGISSTRASRSTPAQFTRAVTGPSAAAAVMYPATLALSVTSSGKSTTWPPATGPGPGPAATSTSPAATMYPDVASRPQIACPMPPVPPVTSATAAIPTSRSRPGRRRCPVPPTAAARAGAFGLN